jgi:hypothetical protein
VMPDWIWFKNMQQDHESQWVLTESESRILNALIRHVLQNHNFLETEVKQDPVEQPSFGPAHPGAEGSLGVLHVHATGNS